MIIEKEEIRKFIELADLKPLKSTSRHGVDNISNRLVYLFSEYRDCDTQNYIDILILNRLKSIAWTELNPSIFIIDDLAPIMMAVNEDEEVYEFFFKNWDDIIPKFLSTITTKAELDTVDKLFDKYEKPINFRFEEGKAFSELLLGSINRIYEYEANVMIETDQHEIFSKDDFSHLENRVNNFFGDLTSHYFDNAEDIYPNNDIFENIDIDDLIAENLRADEEASLHEDDWKYSDTENDNEDVKIDDLFSYYER